MDDILNYVGGSRPPSRGEAPRLSLDTLDSLVRCPHCGATVTSEISPGYHNCGFCYTYFTANATGESRAIARTSPPDCSQEDSR